MNVTALRPILSSMSHLFMRALVSSLQVLASVKNQIEQLAARQKDFPEQLLAAQQCLLARESSLIVQGSALSLSLHKNDRTNYKGSSLH